MSDIELREVLKIYPFTQVKGLFGKKKQRQLLQKQKTMPYITNEGVIVLQHINLHIRAGEFVVLLGPSGCGKTTLLRLIAGLEDPTLGEILFDGELMNPVPPEDRDVAMVFQNYSLYPHMTVFDNIAFTLRTAHMPREELTRTVEEVCELLGIRELQDRLPSQLSGGQLQRVAIARALVRKPKVFLMDEPFSNLDAQLRSNLRALVKKIHATLGTTFLYVTHDQHEALSLGQRILVLRDGVLVQDGTPAQIYNRPADTYVATLVGSPQMNLFPELPVSDGYVNLLGKQYAVPAGTGAAVTLGIRPVHILRSTEGTEAEVLFTEPLGSETVVHLSAGGTEITALFETAGGEVFLRGQKLRIMLPRERLHFFDETGKRI